MFCSKCGNELAEGAAFCQKCGTKVEGSGQKSNEVSFQEAEEKKSFPVYENFSEKTVKDIILTGFKNAFEFPEKFYSKENIPEEAIKAVTGLFEENSNFNADEIIALYDRTDTEFDSCFFTEKELYIVNVKENVVVHITYSDITKIKCTGSDFLGNLSAMAVFGLLAFVFCLDNFGDSFDYVTVQYGSMKLKHFFFQNVDFIIAFGAIVEKVQGKKCLEIITDNKKVFDEKYEGLSKVVTVKQTTLVRPIISYIFETIFFSALVVSAFNHFSLGIGIGWGIFDLVLAALALLGSTGSFTSMFRRINKKFPRFIAFIPKIFLFLISMIIGLSQ